MLNAIADRFLIFFVTKQPQVYLSVHFEIPGAFTKQISSANETCDFYLPLKFVFALILWFSCYNQGHTDGHMALLHLSTHSLIVGDHCVG